MVELIYCADGNSKYAATAIRYGFKYGAQLPNTVYFPVHFADQDDNDPNLPGYMKALEKHRPALATVLDWDERRTFEEVMTWAEMASQFVREAIIIIPKVMGGIPRIPETVCGVPVRLGYSVPTSRGGTSLPLWEFGRREVHLLGGSPQKQHRLAAMLNVRSADGNYISKMSSKYNQFFSAGKMRARNGHFPRLRESAFGWVDNDAPYLAFELSVMNMRALWAGCRATIRFAVESDVPAIGKIASQYKSELGWVRRQSLLESIARRNLVIAEYNGQLVGFVNYRACKAYPNSKNTDRRIAWSTIYEIAVDRARHGESIGAGLMAAVPEPRRLKCTTDNKPANDFYEAQGMKLAGIDPGRKRPLNMWRSVV